MKKGSLSKWITTATLAFLTFLLSTSNAFSAIILRDDFSETYIDSQKWLSGEFVREVVGGKLVSKIGSDSGTGEFRNRTPFQDPGSISAIQCEITLVQTILDTGNEPAAFARIDGRFYNAKAGTSETGDIWAAVFIGDLGSGLEAFWRVKECLNDDGTEWELRGSGTLPTGTLAYDTPYTARIAYDSSTNNFTFTVAGVSDSFTGPDRMGDEFLPYKGLVTGVNSDGGSGNGYAHALFDNVYINDPPVLHDTFDDPLSLTNWQALEVVREIESGKLRLNAQAQDARGDSGLGLTQETDYDYLEAKVLVESGSHVSTGATAIARIAGFYYNDSRGPGSGLPYNEYQGNVWVRNRIVLDENNNLKAECYIERMNYADPWAGDTDLLHHEFSIPIAFDTEYTLSIEWAGYNFILKCNEEAVEYYVTTEMYLPYAGFRYLHSRVYADPGESGYVKARFDDVYTNETTIRVPDNMPTIQAAIDVAEIGETVLVADGTYTGDGNKNLDFGGKIIFVQSENGPNSCIIDCEGSGRGFYFHSGEGEFSILSGFTITNGQGTNDYGGGIHCESSSPTITNCIISGNAGSIGGGIRCESSSPTITSCIISGNSVASYAGGIMLNFSDATVTNCIISGNSATFGGGIGCDDSSPTITNCTISDNTGTSISGGFHCWSSFPTITNCIFWGNTPDEIHVESGEATVAYSDVLGGYSGEGNIDVDPLFVDPGNGDFHISSDSPCIDAGKVAADTGFFGDSDIDGDSRPQLSRYDIGADEYVSADDLAVDFGSSGIYHYYDGIWSKLTNWDPENLEPWPNLLGDHGLAGDFGQKQLYLYNGSSWKRISKWDAENLKYWGSELAGDFGPGRNLYTYDGSSWHKISSWDPVKMESWSNQLVVNFGSYGHYVYDGTGWRKITNWASDDMVAWGEKLVVDFGANGLYVYDASGWNKISNWNAETMESWNDKLAVGFGANGLYMYDGSDWDKISNWNPEAIEYWNNKLVVDFGANGLYTCYYLAILGFKFTDWDEISSWNPDHIEPCGDGMLVVDFGASGLWNYDGASWSKLSEWDADNSGDTMIDMGLY